MATIMLPVRAPLLLLLLPLPTAVLLAVPAAALDNGLALTPPRGFRTWNQFGIEVNQSMMSDIIRAMAQRRPPARGDGAPLSLVDLGYTHAGVDDGWQLCGSGAAGGFHNASGYPNIDPAKVRALLSCARQAALGRSVSDTGAGVESREPAGLRVLTVRGVFRSSPTRAR